MRYLLIAFLALSLGGCSFYSRWQEQLANAELTRQQTGLVQDFRDCLRHNSTSPQGQRDCSVYNQARHQIDISVLQPPPRQP